MFNITTAAATDQEVAIFFTIEGFRKANVPSIPELVFMAQEMDVKFLGCQMTKDVLGIEKEAFVNGIEVGGTVTILEFAKNADVTLIF
ncbi:DsrE/DsrF/DrsH-like family protein [Peribacillus sp. NPDC058075]|uniref:DsrE/DsrF/DrsH-like family protein n=1 Tax=unclassified Peribacillus TaxID=2675266 RepID=UPI0036DAE6AF